MSAKAEYAMTEDVRTPSRRDMIGVIGGQGAALTGER
jgi:hypothetical protein